ncbi:MAG: hypothetical protein ACRD0Z_11695 [Acidimicrobiales bacterium]
MHPIERLRFIARADGEPASLLAIEAAYTLADLTSYEPNAVLTACRRLLDKHPACGPLWWVAARSVGAGDPPAAARQAAAELCSDATSDRLAEVIRASFAGGETYALGTPCEVAIEALQRSRAGTAHVIGSAQSVRRAARSAAASGIEDLVGYLSGEEDEALEGAGVVIVEALAAGASACVLTPESADLVAAAGRGTMPVWLVAGVGRVLPEVLFQAVVDRTSAAGRSPGAAAAATPVGYEAFALAIMPAGSGVPDHLSKLAAGATPHGLELLRRAV